MIYDDQKQMMDAREDTETYAIRRVVLVNAFAAIDREALIEKVAESLLAAYREDSFEKRAERALVAAGIIPERER